MEVEEKEFSDKAKKDFLLVDRAIKNNDQKAYAELMKRYRKSVFHLVLKMVRNADEAEDLTIEAFAKAFKGLHKFNPEFTFSTWLFRIATNNCIDYIRKKRVLTTSIDNPMKDSDGDEMTIDIKDSALNPEDQNIRTQKIELMQMIVTKLPSKYQVLIKMRYFQELSYEEIADNLDFPLGTVKAQLHRAKELLFDMVKDRKDAI
ncbi:MAG: sigma-70 family RNA polymerase sigma factor [Bacteroidetes bacterium]|nr:MAG: sigma-70 family RNA polymerase sigma factor [Bacteroidota bacterium]